MIAMRHTGWIDRSEFIRVATEMHRRSTTEHTHWLGSIDCKYLQIRMDQRTGDFLVCTSSGVPLSAYELYHLFPALNGNDQSLVDPVPQSVDNSSNPSI